ncbi:MAG: HAMP domain-containing sensor histidine kinase [Solirubrobacterales bacterium]
MIGPALIVLGGVLLVGLVATSAIMRLRSIKTRTVGALLLATLLPLVTVVASGIVMFESAHDLEVLAVVGGTTVVAMAAAVLLLRGILAPLDSLTEIAHDVAAGDLTARANQTGVSETDELARSFNTMAENLESLFDARRQLVAWASHDLRTPLAALRAMLEAVEDGVSTTDEYLPEMQSQVDRLSQLIDDLFELATIDASALSLELDEVRVGDLVNTCVRGFEGQARAEGVTLRAEIDRPDSVVRCAPEKIERVMMNLLVNALRHTPSDGTVAIRVTTEDPAQVRFSVEDTGEGLPQGDPERLFDRFQRGDESRQGAGAGLGLAIARGLVEAHGGSIKASNRVGGGATFAFEIPAAP